MNIYKSIVKDLREVGASQREAHLAFVALSLGGLHYLHYIERLREKRRLEKEAEK